MMQTNKSPVKFIVPRRQFLSGMTGALAAGSMMQVAAPEAASAEQTKALPKPGEFPIRVLASDNGLEATRRAYDMIVQGADVLDACIAGVNIVEDDPNDMTVGYGGLPNEDGVVELDAAVMHGPTHRAGSVASLQQIKNPSKVAKLVMEQTDHVLLVGEGALKFARAHGFKEEDLLTEKARKIWLYWRQKRDQEDDWIEPPDELLDPDVKKYFKRPTGTIHCAGIDARGDISCTTTTSGLAFKLAGRVGDSPIIGAGLYVDNAIGSCGSTGRGEANLLNLSSSTAVELMRSGRSPKDAGLELLRRIAANTVPRLRNKEGRPTYDLTFYLLAKSGEYAAVSLWGPSKFAVTDKAGTRHEACVSLYERPAK
jgi:N4-(beta-N-acetylglucosaminyl)-L-asparaginase